MKNTRKRIIALLTVMTLFLPVFQAGVPIYATKTLIRNTFETDYDGWISESEFATLESVKGEGYQSERSMKFSNRQDSTDNVNSQKGFYLDGGVKYDYSIWVKHDEVNLETFSLTLRWLHYDKDLYESKVIATKKVEQGEWTEIKASYTAPEGTENLTLFLGTDSTADFYFDEFVVTKSGFSSTFTVNAAVPANPGLKDYYANHFRVGNILNGTTVRNNTVTATILREYNSITMENEMKPSSTIVKTANGVASTNTNIQASLNSNAVAIMDFCKNNNIPVRGHVLVWHGQTPDWYFLNNIQDTTDYRNHANSAIPWASKAVMEQRMESYIKNMFKVIQTQYPSVNLYAYDVVNEAVLVNGTAGPRLPGFDKEGAGGAGAAPGNSPWVQIYGDNSFVRRAFVYARQYAPATCKLFYNDYNEWDPVKRDYIINQFLNPLFNDGLLDGMGMQSHISADPSGTSWSGFERYNTAMDKYAATGVEVQVTELDVTCDNNGAAAWTEAQQATRYKQVFENAIAVNKRNGGKVTAICIWGPNDANTWIGRAGANPTLHNANNQAKPAYNTLASLIPQSQWGDGNNPQFLYGAGNTQPNQWGWYFNDTFEGSVNGWTGRGSSRVETSGRTCILGAESLAVRDRTASWQTMIKTLDPNAFIAGKAYSFSACAVYLDGNNANETFSMTLQYNDSSGTTRWANIATKTASQGQWIQLANSNYTIPAGATNLGLIIESTGDTLTFYIDEVIGAVGGTTISAPSGVTA